MAAPTNNPTTPRAELAASASAANPTLAENARQAGAQSVNALYADDGAQDRSYRQALVAATCDTAASFQDDAYLRTPDTGTSLYANAAGADQASINGAAAVPHSAPVQPATAKAPVHA